MADTTKPVLVSIDIPATIDVRNNALITYSLTVRDDSGIAWGYVHFEPKLYLKLPEFGSIVFSSLELHNATVSGDLLSNEIEVSRFNQGGTYKISNVQLMDNAGNYIHYEADQLQAMGLQTSITLVGTTPDGEAPVLHGLDIPVYIDQSLGPARTTFTARASDPLTDVSAVFIRFNGDLNQSQTGSTVDSYQSMPVIFMTSHYDTWADGTLSFHPWMAAANGVYNIENVQTLDTHGNIRTYNLRELARLGVNTSTVVSDGSYKPNVLTDTLTVAAPLANEPGSLVLKLSADQWNAQLNTLKLTLDYDSSLARFDGWRAGGDGSYEVRTSVMELGRSGTIDLTAAINNKGDASDFLELRFKLLNAKGSFSYDIFNVSMNDTSLVNDFGNKVGYSIPVKRSGTDGADRLAGSSADDLFDGRGGDDVFSALAGSDAVDGGAGIDQVIYSGKRADYTVEKLGGTIAVSALASSAEIQQLSNVERVAFADVSIGFDSNAAQAFRLYQAAFDRAPELAGLGFWISAMDKGLSLAEMAGFFMQSPEFIKKFGSAPSNAALVDGFYLNTLHRAGDAEGVRFWNGLLDDKTITAGQMLVYFSESPENQAQTAEIVGAGMSYIPLA